MLLVRVHPVSDNDKYVGGISDSARAFKRCLSASSPRLCSTLVYIVAGLKERALEFFEPSKHFSNSI